MILIDANVLIAAGDTDHPEHARVNPWFRELLGSGESYVIPDLVWVAFFRILSNPRATLRPVAMADLLDFSRRVRAEYDYLPLSGSHDDWESFSGIVAAADARGNLVNDAYLASLATQLTCPIATLDRDFRRFEGVRIVIPGAA